MEWGGAATTSTTTTASTASIWCSLRRSCAGPQPEAAEALALSEDGPIRRAFLTRLEGEIAKRGTIEALRNGIKDGALHLDLFYGTPSAHNAQAPERFEQNRFTVAWLAIN